MFFSDEIYPKNTEKHVSSRTNSISQRLFDGFKDF